MAAASNDALVKELLPRNSQLEVSLNLPGCQPDSGLEASFAASPNGPAVGRSAPCAYGLQPGDHRIYTDPSSSRLASGSDAGKRRKGTTTANPDLLLGANGSNHPNAYGNRIRSSANLDIKRLRNRFGRGLREVQGELQPSAL